MWIKHPSKKIAIWAPDVPATTQVEPAEPAKPAAKKAKKATKK